MLKVKILMDIFKSRLRTTKDIISEIQVRKTHSEWKTETKMKNTEEKFGDKKDIVTNFNLM